RLAEGRCKREAARDEGLDAVLKVGSHPQAGVIQVETAAQLEVLDDRCEQYAASDERNSQAADALCDECARAARSQRSGRAPPRTADEERHLPEADEAADD